MKQWDELTLPEQAKMMEVAVRNGIYNLNDIKAKYNEFAGGGYKSSNSIRSRISQYEGKAMTGAKDPLSGKYGTNRSFEAEDKSFYNALPESIREQVLSNPQLADNLYSYSYNVGAGNFRKRVVPTLEKYYQGQATIKDIEDSMWASGDKKLRGLRIRRAEEREGVRNALLPTQYEAPPVSTFIYNPYITQQEQTTLLPYNVPDEDAYVTTHTLPPSEQRRQKLRETIEATQRFNNLMNLFGIQNTAIPAFMPQTENTFLNTLGILNPKAEGGSIHIKHPGRLTALKERTGKTEAELYNDGNPAHKKMVVFARNSRKWKHGDGGNLFDGNSQPTQKMKISKPYYSYDENGRKIDDTLNYNISFPEVVIIPDSKKSPAERNENERYRQRTQRDYAEQKGREYTERQITKSQKEWENSLEKQSLDYAQTAATGIGIGADIVSGLPIYSSLKGARVLSEAKTPTDYIEGGLWLTPVTGGIYHTAKPAISKTVNHIVNQAQSIGKEMGNPFEFAEGIYNYARREPIPFAEKEAAAQRMDAFIHSPEYIQKQKAAGLSDSEIVDFQDMIARRLNGGNFPAYRMKRKSNGLSLSLPKPFGGIYMRKGIPADDFLNAFDHEVAHYSTVNFGKTDNELLKWLNKENPTVMEKVMGYNINSVPYRPKADVPKVRTARGLSPDTEKLNYFRDEQELRSNAYAMLQEAQRRGISIDELVDQYTMQSTGEIFGHAPAPLRYLNYAYTPENMKKFIKSFLSVSTPVTIGIKATTQNDNE